MAQGGNKPPIIPPEILAAIERGWRVFPVHSAPAGNCSCEKPDCKRPGKHPRTRYGHLDATSDREKILAWLRRWPGCNWAVATGEGSYILVLDVDGASGRSSLARLEQLHGTLPATLISLTVRKDGGEQRWLAFSPDVDVRGSAGKIGLGLDVKANGGYAIIPPSIHETGRVYEWINPSSPIADAPSWLIQIALAANLQSGNLKPRPDTHSDNRIPKGRRNTTLTGEAGRLRRRGCEKSRTWTWLLEINAARCKPPLPEDEIAAIATSISRPAYAPAAPDNLRLPLEEFVLDAILKNRQEKDDNPKIVTPLFVFARIMKARPEFGGKDGYAAAQILDMLLPQLPGVVDPWEVTFGEIHDDPRAEFIRSWDAVKTPGFGDSLTDAWSNAQRFPLKPLREYSRKYAQFLSLVGHLQQDHPGQSIALPVERIGGILHCDRTTVGNYRKRAEQDALLTKVKLYNKELKEADEFRFDIGAFDWTTGQQLGSTSLGARFVPDTAPSREPTPISSTLRPFPPSHGESKVSEVSDVSGGNPTPNGIAQTKVADQRGVGN
jgi:Bifunctional DNA primase/polymerase, N-terminal/Primase C terminal 1 (PriCT-1)